MILYYKNINEIYRILEIAKDICSNNKENGKKKINLFCQFKLMYCSKRWYSVYVSKIRNVRLR